MAPIAVASVLGAGVALLFRWATDIQNPVLGCAICSVIVLTITVSTLYLIPAGRRALGDFRSVFRLLTGKSEVPVTQAESL